MTCMSCGRSAEASAQFCSSCGRPLQVYAVPVRPLSRLERPRGSRLLAGVCAAFALRYGWDLTVVRLVLVLTTLFTGVPVIAYLIAWVVIPNAHFALPAQATAPLNPVYAAPPPPASRSGSAGSGPGSIVS